MLRRVGALALASLLIVSGCSNSASSKEDPEEVFIAIEREEAFPFYFRGVDIHVNGDFETGTIQNDAVFIQVDLPPGKHKIRGHGLVDKTNEVTFEVEKDGVNILMFRQYTSKFGNMKLESVELDPEAYDPENIDELLMDFYNY